MPGSPWLCPVRDHEVVVQMPQMLSFRGGLELLSPQICVDFSSRFLSRSFSIYCLFFRAFPEALSGCSFALVLVYTCRSFCWRVSLQSLLLSWRKGVLAYFLKPRVSSLADGAVRVGSV